MKKSFYCCICFLIGLFFTSCLDEGNQKITVSSQPAVIEKKDSAIIIHLNNNKTLSTKYNSKYDDGDCYLLDFTVDYSYRDTSNTNFVAEIIESKDVLVNKYPLNKTLLDTATILPQEKTIAKVQMRNVYIRGQLFVFTEHQLDSTQIINKFNLSYNAEEAPKVDQDGKRVYDLFLRTIKEKNGDKTSEKTRILTNAYDLDQFINDKSQTKKDTIFFKINYPVEFNKDTTKITRWNSTLFKVAPKTEE